jgi:hypothetical protein
MDPVALCPARTMRLAALLLLGSAPAADALDPTSCAAIAAYDAREGVPSLVEQFDHMAFTYELCIDERAPCAVDELRRREEGLSIVLKFWESAARDDHKTAIFGENLNYVVALLDRMTPVLENGFEVIAGDSAEPRYPVVELIFGSREELRKHVRILDGAQEGGIAEEAMDIALRVGGGCRGLAYGNHDLDPTRPDLVFIESEQSDDMIARFVKEEIFNAFLPNDPIGDASLFDDPWGRPDDISGQPPVFEYFSHRDVLLLRLLYAPELAPGMSREAAVAALARKIDGACPSWAGERPGQ